MRLKLLSVVAVFIWAATTPTLRAMIVAPADLSDLARGARVVVHGRVVDLQAQWAEGRRRVETLVTIEAASYLKGDFGPRVTVRVPGGDLGRYRSVVPGAPTFHEGDELVLFLGGEAPAIPYVLGVSQGVFRVIRDEATGIRRVLPPPLVARSDRAEVVRRGEQVMPTLDEFVSTVRGVLRPVADTAAGTVASATSLSRRGHAVR